MGAFNNLLIEFQDAETRNLNLRFEVITVAKEVLGESARQSLLRRLCRNDLHNRFHKLPTSAKLVSERTKKILRENVELEKDLAVLNKLDTQERVDVLASRQDEDPF